MVSIEGRSLITGHFNVHFNQFIIPKRKTGVSRGGSNVIIENPYSPKEKLSAALDEIREDYYKNDSISSSDLKKIFGRLRDTLFFYHETEALQQAISDFAKDIEKTYNLTLPYEVLPSLDEEKYEQETTKNEEHAPEEPKAEPKIDYITNKKKIIQQLNYITTEFSLSNTKGFDYLESYLKSAKDTDYIHLSGALLEFARSIEVSLKQKRVSKKKLLSAIQDLYDLIYPRYGAFKDQELKYIEKIISETDIEEIKPVEVPAISEPTPTRERSKPSKPHEKPVNVITHTKSKIPIIATIMLILIVAFSIFISHQKTATNVVEQTVVETQSTIVSDKIYSKIDISNIIRDKASLERKTVSVLAHVEYLYESYGGVGSYANILFDDYGNQILLEGLTQEQSKLIKSNTSIAYNVTGLFYQFAPFDKKQRSKITVTSIVIAERPFTLVNKTVLVNVTKQVNVTLNRSTSSNIVTSLLESIGLVRSFCSDGTESGNCSISKPNYCSNGGLVENPQLCGCSDGFRLYKGSCIAIQQCSDKTLSPECSVVNKGKQCVNSSLIDNAKLCGCPADNKIIDNVCKPILRCSDKTEYGQCSNSKPLYCDSGKLVDKASICGCNYDQVNENNHCVSRYQTGAKQSTFWYRLKGTSYSFDFTVYKGLDEYLAGLPRSISYYSGQAPPTEKDFIDKQLYDATQMPYLDKIVDFINTSYSGDDGPVAISLVQTIPYDSNGLATDTLNSRYPYEVIYDHTGVCGEKTNLLAYLLSKLGYGVVIFEFKSENHAAVGIACDSHYDYLDSGYCFVESTTPSIITDSWGSYVSVGKLSSTPQIISVSAGDAINDITKDYLDAIKFRKYTSGPTTLPPSEYNDWKRIVDYYGITTG